MFNVFKKVMFGGAVVCACALCCCPITALAMIVAEEITADMISPAAAQRASSSTVGYLELAQQDTIATVGTKLEAKGKARAKVTNMDPVTIIITDVKSAELVAFHDGSYVVAAPQALCAVSSTHQLTAEIQLKSIKADGLVPAAHYALMVVAANNTMAMLTTSKTAQVELASASNARIYPVLLDEKGTQLKQNDKVWPHFSQYADEYNQLNFDVEYEITVKAIAA